MSATRLSGVELAAMIRAEVAERAATLARAGTPPTLAAVVATADQASAWYVRSIASAAARVGVGCEVVDLAPDPDRATIATALARLDADPAVHGIVLQTPLPAGLSVEDLGAGIDPAKNVDGANPLSLGRLAAGVEAFAPATAESVVALLDHHGIELSGRQAVVVGRSTVVGKPLAHLLLDRDATVTVCHSRTPDLAAITSRADVLVAAAGRSELITARHVRHGAVVVDVGTNPTPDGGLVGDVHAEEVAGLAGALTPVPGGVGPVTTALLLRHTVMAAAR